MLLYAVARYAFMQKLPIPGLLVSLSMSGTLGSKIPLRHNVSNDEDSVKARSSFVVLPDTVLSERNYHIPADRIEIPRGWRSVIPRCLLFVVLSLFSLLLSQVFPFLTLHTTVEFLSYRYSLSVPVPVLILGVLPLRALMLLYDSRQWVDSTGVHAVIGLASVKKEIFHIKFKDIAGVEVQQSLLDRLIGIGKISIGTPMSGVNEFVITGIDSPHYYAKLIDMYEHSYWAGEDKRESNTRL